MTQADGKNKFSFEFDEDIPAPSIKATRLQYPIRFLRVGQSWYCPATEQIPIDLLAARVSQAASSTGRYSTPRKKYTMAREGNGVRVWRLS